ncbi:hypothetical protein [Caballeronia sp. LZ019]|uniref:hypothetical protein n=1 Tax=Caballeronia sp. LZ019 TaxID=3038555 RepID=UPI00285971E1|nr:hypothetical protein [Caballeronia sp. LZ019]MDR5809842.1 hypothetical protein [Caballeronia sp. LZ019]
MGRHDLRELDKPIASALWIINASGSDSSWDSTSKREQAAREFADLVKRRVIAALHDYLLSHGVYVRRQELGKALVLEECRTLLQELSLQFDSVGKAIGLAQDLGSISLGEKEKAMAALYEIESRFAEAKGQRGELKSGAVSLQRNIKAWPTPPSFIGAFCLALLGCAFLVARSYPFGLVLIAIASWLGFRRPRQFETTKREVIGRISAAEQAFDSLVTQEISPRSTLSNTQDMTRAKAVILSAIIAVVALAAASYGVFNKPPGDQATNLTSAAHDDLQRHGTADERALERSVSNFSWLVGKMPWGVVKDKRFRSAFNHVPANEWKTIADRLAVTDAGGIQFRNGYYFAEGCKAHFCGSDLAAFAINAATGRGIVIYKAAWDQPAGKSVTRRFLWPDTPIELTPLAEWATSNGL